MFLKKLPNGLDVLVVEDHSVPLASIEVTFKAGSYIESKDISGLISLYAMMTTHGNKDYKTQNDYNYNLGKMGAALTNCVTTVENTTSFFTVPKENLDAGLGFMNSSIRFASIYPEELEREKGIELAMINKQKANPANLLQSAIDNHLWGDLKNRKTPQGNRDLIHDATSDDLRLIGSRYFNPDNALIIVGGDVNKDHVFDQVGKLFGDWKPAGFDPAVKWPVPEFSPLKQSDFQIIESEQASSPLLAFFWQGPDTRTDPNATYAADVFTYIINQNSSALKNALIKSGLALSVNISYLTLKHVGTISLIIVPDPAKIKECIAEVKKQIGLMESNDYISDRQIETSKRILDIAQIREEEITSDYIHTLSFWWSSASLDYLLTYNDNLNKVNRAAIKNYVHKYISSNPFCSGLLITPEMRSKLGADIF
jgi:zinc protease